MKTPLVIHPFILAIYPILTLLVKNIGYVKPSDTVRSLIASLVITAVILVLMRLLYQNWHKAGLLTSLYLLLFYGFTHFTNLVGRYLPLSLYDLYRYTLALFVAVLIILVWLFYRKPISGAAAATKFLNIVMITAVAFPLFTTTIYMWQHRENNVIIDDTSINVKTNADQLPDIYYIITDEYTRSDVLQELFNHDNSDFLQRLQELGFFIVTDAHSNYSGTLPSLASSLNMTYVDPEMTDHTLSQLVQENKIMSTLKKQGYQIVTTTTGIQASEIKDANIYYAPRLGMISEFEQSLLLTTLPGAYFETYLLANVKQQRFLYIFDLIDDIVQLDKPKFTFLHIYSPHRPLIFDPDGKIVEPVNDALSTSRYAQAYSDEVTYLNHKLIEAAETILESDHPAIIIIQGDHGSHAYYDEYSAANSCVKERLSILTAIYVPDENATWLDNVKSPVNIFRLLLNQYLQTNFDLLPNNSYFVENEAELKYIDVTDRLDIPCQ